jgi:hypothetical protein
MINHLNSALAVVALLAACDTKGQDPASCVQGWWVSATNACSTCGGANRTNPNPECTFADCQQLSCQGFMKNGAVFDAVLTYSKTAGTLSTVGPGVWRRYSVSTDGSIRIAGSQGPSLTCSAAQLKGSYSSQTPAPQSIANALSQRATTTSVVSFRGVQTGS